MTVSRTVVAAVVGLALATGLAFAAGKSAADTLVLVGVSTGAALAVGLLGAVLLHVLRNASFLVSMTIVALTSAAGVMVGAWSAGRAMFLSGDDLDALGVVVVAAGTVGVCSAVVLAARVASASRSLVDGGERPSIREFAELGERLEEARARERELTSWVSHDLRTPLAGIRAISEALEDGLVTDPETLARYHRTLRHETDRLAGLVDDLFELSRIAAGAVRLRPESLALDDVVSDALAAADPLAAAAGVRLHGELHGAAPQVRLAPREFGRVLGNLLENAIRQSPAGTTVTVTAGADDGHGWVAVTDSCGGIPAGDLPRVFDTGFRGERARTKDARGGLGLAIAKGLVEAHAGDICVQNADGGCRFVVRVPR
jgi:signal transduction histidine kinase